MAISFATLATLTDQVAGPTKATGSFTTVTGRYYLVSAAANQTISNVTSTNGVTYAAVQTGTGSLATWGGTCTSGASGTVTITLASNGTLSASVDEVTGAATANQVVQSAKASAQSVTLVTLASGSATFMSAKNALAMTIEAGWTALTNVGSAARLLTGYKIAGDTTPSWTGTTSTQRIIGIEFTAAENTGWSSATTGPANWTNPNNVFTQDGTNATSTATNGETGYFHSYGFSGLSVVSGATINGIEIRMFGSTTLTPDYSYFFVGSNSGTPVSVNERSIALPVDPTAAAYVTMGSSTDLWGGANTPRAWLPSDFDSTFDVSGAWGATSATTIKVDNVQARVWYTPTTANASNTTQKTMMLMGYGI